MKVSGQFHALTALSLGNEPQYQLDMRLAGPESLSGLCGVDNLPGNRTLAMQAVDCRYTD
jgi:hypothetical protein